MKWVYVFLLGVSLMLAIWLGAYSYSLNKDISELETINTTKDEIIDSYKKLLVYEEFFSKTKPKMIEPEILDFPFTNRGASPGDQKISIEPESRKVAPLETVAGLEPSILKETFAADKKILGKKIEANKAVGKAKTIAEDQVETSDDQKARAEELRKNLFEELDKFRMEALKRELNKD